ncbi:hypothetical protein F4802DRAFT_620101 [Xylaria palmicola]|nr:hypothetical protein F4802DRAFT_620101 [Xylaria palmicola]
MTNVELQPPPRQTVSDYGLTRMRLPLGALSLEFMGPYIDPTGNAGRADWAAIAVVGEEETSLNVCGISPLLNAYVTMEAFLVDGQHLGAERRTPMRYADMMVDNYLSAGGDLRAWQFIGTHDIVHKATRDQINGLFQQAGMDLRDPGVVELLPDNEEFADVTLGNPFTGGVAKLLQKYKAELGNATMKRTIFISEGFEPWVPGSVEGSITLHLVIELCRPGDRDMKTDSKL